MERIMLGITLRDHKRNTWIRPQTGVNDIISRREYIDGWDWDTLHYSKTTDGQKEWQSGHHENGQDGRENLKQDGETALSATWVLRGQE